MRAPSAPGVGTAAGGSSSVFFFAFAALLALLAVLVPRLICRLRLFEKLGVQMPFVSLLERPG